MGQNGKPSPYNSGIIKEFSNGNYIFLPRRLTEIFSDYMRKMPSDFGILPHPLLSEVDEYISFIRESATSVAVPAIVGRKAENIERVSAIIEATSAESYRRVTEKFYETAL